LLEKIKELENNAKSYEALRKERDEFEELTEEYQIANNNLEREKF